VCTENIGAILSGNQINFELARAVIKPDSYETLVKIKDIINGCPDAKLEIGGHTDSDGDDASNQMLSDARANAVRDWLVKVGIKADAILAKGYGESSPLAANDTNGNKAKNRRIEFRLVQ
jgi:OmpA-OmpF porin, OOP family